MGSHALLQEVFPTQGSNSHLLRALHCRRTLYPLSHLVHSKWLKSASIDTCVCVCMRTYIPACVDVGFEYSVRLQCHLTSLVAQRVRSLPAMWETRVRSLGGEDPLEKEMATHSSILAWKISWTEEPGRLQSMGSQRVRHD